MRGTCCWGLKGVSGLLLLLVVFSFIKCGIMKSLITSMKEIQWKGKEASLKIESSYTSTLCYLSSHYELPYVIKIELRTLVVISLLSNTKNNKWVLSIRYLLSLR